MEKRGKHFVFKTLLFLVSMACCFPALAQEISLSGTVTNTDSGEPIAGVTVEALGRNISAQTDQTGTFVIRTSLPVNLVFRSVGYVEQQLEVVSEGPVHVRLAPSLLDLEEVVVVGYGTQKKTSLTAAVSTMKGEEISTLPSTNLSNNLGGRLAGVIVKQTTGEPGHDGSSIFVRGISTTGSSQPLLIVDGVPRDFQKLDPNTIESFTVLKDAAAVAPYGVAGANGVILVTTKRGRSGRPSVNYTGYMGFQNPTVLPDLVDGYEYAVLRNLAADNEGVPRPYTDAELQIFKDKSDMDAYPNFNPFEGLISKNAKLHNHSLDISGGTENVRYFAGLGYQFQEGMWETTHSNRFNLVMNLDVDVTSTTLLSLNVNGIVQKYEAPPSDLSDWGTLRIFELVKFAHPGFTGPHFFSNGMYGTHAASAIWGTGYNRTNALTAYTQLSVQQEIPSIPGLNLKATFAYDPSVTNNKIWVTPMELAALDRTTTPPVIRNGIFGATKATLDHNIDQRSQITFQGSVNYANSFGAHNINAVGVFETKSNNQSLLGAFRRNFSLLIDEISMGSSNTADATTTGLSSTARQIGALYRIAYDYSGKYMVEASGRYDGHYYFAPDRRFGFFPAFSLGWRLSEENFLRDNPWLHNLKLRASYGEVGALAGSPFQYLSTYNVTGPGYAFGGNGVQIVTERAEANPFITWERARKTDLGLEVSLWQGKFDLEVDYFYEKRSNMLVSPAVVVPLEYGIGLSQENAGIMENRGIEAAAVFNFQFSDDLSASLGGTITYARNKLLQIFETDATFNSPTRRRTGRSLGMQFGYESIGYFLPEDFDSQGNLKAGVATQPWGPVQPGDIRYKDVNGDGQININDEVAIGDPSTPQIIYGISPSIRYKSLSLDILLQGAARTSFYFRREAVWPFWNSMTAHKDNFDYWRPDNLDARHPRLTSAPTTNNTQASSHWMQDVSYLRLKNITLTVQAPSRLSEQLRLSNAQIFFSAQNLLTWTNTKGIDPEIAYDRGNTYPQQAVMSVGLRLGL